MKKSYIFVLVFLIVAGVGAALLWGGYSPAAQAGLIFKTPVSRPLPIQTIEPPSDLIPPQNAVSNGLVTGTVTQNRSCPDERLALDPWCASKPYSTSIDITNSENANVIKIETDSEGAFSVSLPPGSYILAAEGADDSRSCGGVSVEVKDSQSTNADISCYAGGRGEMDR